MKAFGSFFLFQTIAGASDVPTPPQPAPCESATSAMVQLGNSAKYAVDFASLLSAGERLAISDAYRHGNEALKTQLVNQALLKVWPAVEILVKGRHLRDPDAALSELNRALLGAQRTWNPNHPSRLEFDQYLLYVVQIRLRDIKRRTQINQKNTEYIEELSPSTREALLIDDFPPFSNKVPMEELTDSVLAFVLKTKDKPNTQAALLYYFEGKTQEEAGVILGIGRQGAQVRLRKFLRELREHLQKEYPDVSGFQSDRSLPTNVFRNRPQTDSVPEGE